MSPLISVMSALITMSDYISDFAVLSVEEHSGDLLVKTCKRCFREFDESEVDVVNVSSTTGNSEEFRGHN